MNKTDFSAKNKKWAFDRSPDIVRRTNLVAKMEINKVMAKEKREEIEQEERKWNLFALCKWDVIKKRKAEML